MAADHRLRAAAAKIGDPAVDHVRIDPVRGAGTDPALGPRPMRHPRSVGRGPDAAGSVARHWWRGLPRLATIALQDVAKRRAFGSRALTLLWALCLCVFGAAGASAQTLTMRSGEHATFTRLTLPLPPGQGWQLGRTDDGYGLRLPGSAATLATGGVFARIPRSRLAALRPAATGIDLLLACDCHAIGFEEGDLLVVDIRDGPPPPGARFEARLAGPVRPAPAPTR